MIKALSYFKKTLITSITGYTLLHISTLPLLAKTTNLGTLDGSDVTVFAPSDPTNNGIRNYTGQIEQIISTIIGFLTILAGLYFLMYFIMGGLSWITASGDSKKVEEARSKMTNAAIGLVIVIASYAVIYIVGSILGLDILNVGEVIEKLGPAGNVIVNPIDNT